MALSDSEKRKYVCTYLVYTYNIYIPVHLYVIIRREEEEEKVEKKKLGSSPKLPLLYCLPQYRCRTTILYWIGIRIT